MTGMTPPSLPPSVATGTDVDMSCSATGNATANQLDAEAQANLNAVCEAVKNQVISWGPKAKWKIDLLLLPDGSETTADTLCPTTTNDDSDNLKTISSPHFPPSSSLRGIDVAIQTCEVTEPRLPHFDEESIKHLDADEARKRLAKATERVRRLESLIMSQRREMTDKLEAANVRAEKADSETRVLTRHLQRQERDLEARHDVERRLRESEVRVLSRKLRSLTGAQRFAAMSDDEDSEEERRNRDIETRVAQAERLYARERRALRKKLRQSETRSAQREMELDQAREQVTAYMNYAQQLQAHAAQQHHLAQQQHQQHLHSDGATATQPNGATNSNWAAFGDRKRVRSGLDDLLAAAAEAENAEGTRQGPPKSSTQSQSNGGKATNAPSTSSTNDSKPISPAIAAANAHIAKATAAAMAAKRDNDDTGNHVSQEGEDIETKCSPPAILPGPHSEMNEHSTGVPIPPPPPPPPRPFSGLPILPFGPPSSHTPPPTPTTTTPQKKTRSPYVKWTREEDLLLRTAVKSQGCRNWDLIARAVPGRTYHQCRQRWVKVLKNGTIGADDDEDGEASARTTPSPSPESMTGMPTPSTSGGTAHSPRKPPGLFPVGRPPNRATPAPALPTAQVPTFIPPPGVFNGDMSRHDYGRTMRHPSEEAMDSTDPDACMESSL